jgi:hypothetical protein
MIVDGPGYTISSHLPLGALLTRTRCIACLCHSAVPKLPQRSRLLDGDLRTVTSSSRQGVCLTGRDQSVAGRCLSPLCGLFTSGFRMDVRLDNGHWSDYAPLFKPITLRMGNIHPIKPTVQDRDARRCSRDAKYGRAVYCLRALRSGLRASFRRDWRSPSILHRRVSIRNIFRVSCCSSSAAG